MINTTRDVELQFETSLFGHLICRLPQVEGVITKTKCRYGRHGFLLFEVIVEGDQQRDDTILVGMMYRETFHLTAPGHAGQGNGYETFEELCLDYRRRVKERLKALAYQKKQDTATNHEKIKAEAKALYERLLAAGNKLDDNDWRFGYAESGQEWGGGKVIRIVNTNTSVRFTDVNPWNGIRCIAILCAGHDGDFDETCKIMPSSFDKVFKRLLANGQIKEVKRTRTE